jgi:hypothetical protein
MKKLILIPILFLSYFLQAQYVVVKPSQLPAASTINLTDLFILNQGTTTKKVTYNILNTVLKDTFATNTVFNDSIAALRGDIGTGSSQWTTTSNGISYPGAIFPGSIKKWNIPFNDTLISVTELSGGARGFAIKRNDSYQNEIIENYVTQNRIINNSWGGIQNSIANNYYQQNYIANNYAGAIGFKIDINAGTGLDFSGTGKHIRLFSTSAADTANVQKRASTGIHVAYLNASNVATTKIDYEGNIHTTGIIKAGQISAALTDGIPTDAEIDTATGLTPSTSGAGYQVTIKDNNGTGLLYKIESDGTDWYYTVMTKAL